MASFELMPCRRERAARCRAPGRPADSRLRMAARSTVVAARHFWRAELTPRGNTKRRFRSMPPRIPSAFVPVSIFTRSQIASNIQPPPQRGSHLHVLFPQRERRGGAHVVKARRRALRGQAEHRARHHARRRRFRMAASSRRPRASPSVGNAVFPSGCRRPAIPAMEILGRRDGPSSFQCQDVAATQSGAVPSEAPPETTSAVFTGGKPAGEGVV